MLMQIVCAIRIIPLADGAAHTSPVARAILDHARTPVMLPRQPDADMRRDGIADRSNGPHLPAK